LQANDFFLSFGGVDLVLAAFLPYFAQLLFQFFHARVVWVVHLIECFHGVVKDRVWRDVVIAVVTRAVRVLRGMVSFLDVLEGCRR
jgi:hypothetical protein